MNMLFVYYQHAFHLQVALFDGQKFWLNDFFSIH